MILLNCWKIIDIFLIIKGFKKRGEKKWTNWFVTSGREESRATKISLFSSLFFLLKGFWLSSYFSRFFRWRRIKIKNAKTSFWMRTNFLSHGCCTIDDCFRFKKYESQIWNQETAFFWEERIILLYSEIKERERLLHCWLIPKEATESCRFVIITW